MRIGIEACTWSNRRGYGRFVRQLITNMVEEFPEHRITLVVDQHTANESSFPEGAEIAVRGVGINAPTELEQLEVVLIDSGPTTRTRSVDGVARK